MGRCWDAEGGRGGADILTGDRKAAWQIRLSSASDLGRNPGKGLMRMGPLRARGNRKRGGWAGILLPGHNLTYRVGAGVFEVGVHIVGRELCRQRVTRGLVGGSEGRGARKRAVK